MNAMPQPLEAYLPHRGAMLMLTRVIGYMGDVFFASVTITPGSAFYLPGAGVPAYVGLEYMAQTISACDGAQRLGNGQPPGIGFLLGVRQYHAQEDYFKDGDCLTIGVKNVFFAEGMAAFDCAVHVNDRLFAKAVLNVYRPEAGA